MQLAILLLAWCAVSTSAKPQQNSGYDYSAPQGAGLTGAFESLRQPATGPAGGTGQRAPPLQQQLASREAGLQLASQEPGGFHQRVAAPGFVSQEQGVGQQGVSDSSAEFQIGLRQPQVDSSFVPGVGQPQQPAPPALGSFENLRGAPAQFHADFGSRETAPGVRASRPGLPSAEILAPGAVQSFAQGLRPTQDSTHGSFAPQQASVGQAGGFPTLQHGGEFSPQQAVGLPTQQQPRQFRAGGPQPLRPGVSPTDFAFQTQQPGQRTIIAGLTGTPQTPISSESPRAPGQGLQSPAGRGLVDGSLSAPAEYNFKWDVNDAPSGNFYGHQEQRDGAVTRGRYYVTLPDTRVMTVEYYADETGYHPTITFEGEAQQFIPPQPQTAVTGNSARGTATDNQRTRAGLQSPVPGGFPGLPGGIISQPQSLRGTGTQDLAQITQEFVPQTPTPGQLRTPQNIPLQQGFVGPQQLTSARGFSPTPRSGSGIPAQSPTSTLDQQSGVYDNAQPEAQSLPQQLGFHGRQQNPINGQAHVDAAAFGSRPRQGQAFRGQPQSSEAQAQLSSIPASQIRGFSSVEQRGQPDFQPSQRIPGTQAQGVQKPGQLYETPHQGGPSQRPQLTSRLEGSSLQSSELFRQTNFGQNQQHLAQSSGEVQRFLDRQLPQTLRQHPSQSIVQQPSQGLSQQPPHGFDQQPSQGFGQQPSQSFSQQPSEGFAQQPSQGFAQQPSQGFAQQPSQGFDQQPSQGFDQQPSQGFDQQPSQGFAQQPSQGFGQQPSQSFAQQPSQGFDQPPSQGFAQQPSQSFTQQPSKGFGQQPSQSFTQQPSQSFTQQPSQSFTQQPFHGFGQQPSQSLGQQPPQDTTQHSAQANPQGTLRGATQQPARGARGRQPTLGSQAHAGSQDPAAPGFQQQIASGVGISTTPGRQAPQTPTQLYGTPQA